MGENGYVPVKEVWSKRQIARLPEWIREDVDNAYFVDKARKVIRVSNGKKYHIDNKLNDLSEDEWTGFLNSVLITKYPFSGKEGYAYHIRKIHPSPKPPQLMRRIIEFFTKRNEWVLDYFMGVGGTLLGASLCGRKALGIDLCEKYIDAYEKAAKELNLEIQPTLQGDSTEILKNPKAIEDVVKDGKFSLVLIDPPYGDMLSRPRKGGVATPFTDLKEDLGNMPWSEFREVFYESVVNATKLLKDGGHVVIFMRDLQPEGKNLNLRHCDLIDDLNAVDNLFYLGTKIWIDQNVSLRPYGYPYRYVSNQTHQYILIFQKR